MPPGSGLAGPHVVSTAGPAPGRTQNALIPPDRPIGRRMPGRSRSTPHTGTPWASTAVAPTSTASS